MDPGCAIALPTATDNARPANPALTSNLEVALLFFIIMTSPELL